MIDHKLEKEITGNIISKYAKHIEKITNWFHTDIGYVHKIEDVTMEDPEVDIPLDEIFLREIELTIRTTSINYIKNPEQLLEDIEVKKLALSHPRKCGLLKYSFIKPNVEVVSSDEHLIKITGKFPRDWRNINTHFQEYNLYKCDINKYFEVETLNSIASGIRGSSIVNQSVLEILLGKKSAPEIKIDESFNSKYINDLDETKKTIFKAAASKNDILIVKGPPGTGKTKTITQLIKHFVFERKDKVILASRTHAALNNVINNLSHTPASKNYSGIILEKSSYGDNNKEYADRDALLVRNIRERLREFSPSNGEMQKLLKREFGAKSNPKRFLSTPRGFSHPSLFAGTITSAKLEKKLDKGYKFDESILIMDEVSKSTIVDVLRYALYAKQIILVGDDMQLAPIPIRKENYENFYEELNEKEKNIFNQLFFDSVFKRLYSKDNNKLMFKTTYRSPQYILDLYNPIAYNNQIESRVTEVKPIEFRNSKKNENLVKMYTRANLILLNNKGTHRIDKTLSQISKVNDIELEVLMNQLNFISKNIKESSTLDVMVMFVYKDQYKHFFRKQNSKIKYWENKFASFTYGTVDQLQGLEADIVFLNTTYAAEGRRLPSNPKYKTQLQEIKRLNVALSRTRQKFIMLMNVEAYRHAPIFNDNEKLEYTFDDILNKFDVKGNV
ncbi:MAG: AAA family ATPase [Mycoplasma sp.]|nr:AAA family ATPase [Mycoplasma sp.]